MEKPIISLIAAIGKNRELGKGDKLLWEIPEDMQYFRNTTRGHANIMGRKTFESILGYLGKPLPGRTNIIVTRDKDYKVPEGCFAFDSIEKAIEFAKTLRDAQGKQEEEVFIIGGAQIYALGLPYADVLHLTLVDKEFPEADAFFPDYSEFKHEISRRESEGNGYKYAFVDLQR
jgi:dihydrofolate reductase